MPPCKVTASVTGHFTCYK